MFKLFSKPEFEKVSLKQYYVDLVKNLGIDSSMIDVNMSVLIQKSYDAIKIPQRSTEDSAGFDVYLPFIINVPLGSTVCIPTGLRCKMPSRLAMLAYPRSGLGFKYNITLANTVGITDADYYLSETNEGHIMIKITYNGIKQGVRTDSVVLADNKDGDKVPFFNLVPKELTVAPELILGEGNSAFAQVIFSKYYVTKSDKKTKKKKRNGGFGSTSK